METFSSKNSHRVVDRKGIEVDNEKVKEQTHKVPYHCQESDNFNCWVNHNSKSTGGSDFIQNCGHEKKGEKEINVLKSLWNKEIKTSIDDDSKKNPLDTLLKYKYMDQYMSCIFDMQENENEKESGNGKYNGNEDDLMLSMNENENHGNKVTNSTSFTTANNINNNNNDTTNHNNNNSNNNNNYIKNKNNNSNNNNNIRENENEQRRKETSFFNFCTSGSSSLNEKEKGDADKTCEAEGLEKDYMSCIVHSTMKTEEDDVFSAKPTEFSSFSNEQNINFNKSRTDYAEGIYNGSFEDNDLMRNFMSLDLNNGYRNNLQKLNSDDDIFNLLIKNKKFIDREYAELHKRQETSDYSQNVPNANNKQNVHIVPNFQNSKNEKLAFLNNNDIHVFDSMREAEEAREPANFAATEKNVNIIEKKNSTHVTNTNGFDGNNKNTYIEGDCNNTNKNGTDRFLPQFAGMNERLGNIDNRNLLNFLNEWNNEYLCTSETNKTNPYADVILEHLYQENYIKNAGNRDVNVNKNENNSVDYSRMNTKYSNGKSIPSATVRPIPNASSINAPLLSSLNYKNNYFLSDMMEQLQIPRSDNFNAGENSSFIQNETIENNTYSPEPLYMKPNEHIRTAHSMAPGQYVPNPSSIHGLKSTDGNIYLENKAQLNNSFYQSRNNKNKDKPAQSQILQIFKTMLIDLIEREGNDIGLFECIVTAIHAYHKYKNIQEPSPKITQDRNPNELYNTNTIQCDINDVFLNTVFANNYTAGSVESSDSPIIYSLINRNVNKTEAMKNPLHNNVHSMLKSNTTLSHYLGDNPELMAKTTAEEFEIYGINDSATLTKKQMDDSTTPNPYFRVLQNQLNASEDFEKEQLILSQIKREAENITEDNKLMTEEIEEQQRGNRYTNGNTSAVKFHFENNAVSSLKRFQDEIRADKFPETMKHIREEKNRSMTMNQTNTNFTGNLPDDDTFYNDASDNEEKKKWDFHNTFGGQSSTMRNLKSFFSNGVPKSTVQLDDSRISGVVQGNRFMNLHMNISELNNVSKNSKTINGLGWDQSNSESLSKNKRSFRNEIYKKKNTFGTPGCNNHSDTNCMDSGYDLKRIYKSDSVKPTIKSKNNVDIKKLSPEELKCVITKVDEDCLRSILESLYEDRILPLLFNLNGRAEEKKCREVIKNNLFTAYSMFPDEYILKTTATGDDQLVLFAKKTVSENYFVYLNNLEDNYGETMWTHFTAYLEEIAQSDDPSLYEFSGGRYGMAKELKKRNLFFFKDFCLGELCHIVHLSTNKKLIAYEQNFLKPISKCYKYTNAKLGRLSKGEENLENYITTIDELKYYMKALLKYYKGGFNISTLKKKMKTRFNKQICESVFHCIKLIEVLQLDELKDICVIDKDLKFIQAV